MKASRFSDAQKASAPCLRMNAARLRLNQKGNLISGSFDREIDTNPLARPCHRSYFEQPAPFV